MRFITRRPGDPHGGAETVSMLAAGIRRLPYFFVTRCNGDGGARAHQTTDRRCADAVNPDTAEDVEGDPFGYDGRPRRTPRTMDPLDDLRTRFRQLKSRHLAAMEALRAERARELLLALDGWLRQIGFEVHRSGQGLRAVRLDRTVALRADSEDEIRVGEFLGFRYADSATGRQILRITAQLEPGALPEHLPIDVNTAESILAQIAHMEALLAEGARPLQGFEIRPMMTRSNYREPQPEVARSLFASLEDAIQHLLERGDRAGAS